MRRLSETAESRTVPPDRAQRPALWPPAAALALFAALAGPFLVRMAKTWVPGGWDGIAHYGITDLYAREMFPAVSAWAPEYFAGFPFPDFYPPLFYLVVGALARLGLPTVAAFLTVQFLCAAAVPVLSSLGAWRLTGDRVAGFVAGALAAFFMVDGHPIANFGITLRATFDIGLATHLISFCLVLAFYFFFLKADRSPRAAALAAVLLAGVALSNVHVIWDAVLLFLGLALARIVAASTWRERWRSAALHGAMAGGSVLLSAFWLLPMLARLDYVPTQALDPPPLGLLVHSFFRLGVYLVLAAVVAWRERDVPVLGLVGSMVALLVLSSIPIPRAFANLALQPGRFLIAFEFLVPFLVGYLVASVARVFPWKHARLAAGLVCVAIFFHYVEPVRFPGGTIEPALAAEYRRALDALPRHTEGRVLVEMGTWPPSGNAFGLQSLVGAAGHDSLTTVFRESALNVLFAAPLRNSISPRQETFAVDSKIPGSSVLAGQPPEIHLARMRLFDVHYFVLRSPEAKALALSLPEVRPVIPSESGRWDVLELAGSPGYASIPAWEPALTFTDFTVKKRPDYSLDFVRLGEEMFTAGRLETPLVLADEGQLDRDAGWERFKAALIVRYESKDPDGAFARVEAFSRKHPVVLVESSDPLFARLSALRRPTVRVVRRGGETRRREILAGLRREEELKVKNLRDEPALQSAGDRRLASEDIEKILDALDAVRKSVTSAPRIVSARIDHGKAVILLDREPDRPIPVWIRQGYLPNWRTAEGEPVHLATPTFQLAFATSRRLELRYGLHPASRVGMVLSLLALAGVVAVPVGLRRFKPTKNR